MVICVHLILICCDFVLPEAGNRFRRAVCEMSSNQFKIDGCSGYRLLAEGGKNSYLLFLLSQWGLATSTTKIEDISFQAIIECLLRRVHCGTHIATSSVIRKISD